MSEAGFFIRIRGKVSGAYDREGLRRLIRQGILSRIHEISGDRVTWVSAGDFEDLFSEPAPAYRPFSQTYGADSDEIAVLNEDDAAAYPAMESPAQVSAPPVPIYESIDPQGEVSLVMSTAPTLPRPDISYHPTAVRPQAAPQSGSSYGIGDIGPRLVGMLMIGLGFFLVYWSVYAPMQAAENHDATVQIAVKGSIAFPCVIVLGVIYFVLGDDAHELLGTPYKPSGVAWLLLLLLAGVGLVIHSWLKWELERKGYNFG